MMRFPFICDVCSRPFIEGQDGYYSEEQLDGTVKVRCHTDCMSVEQVQKWNSIAGDFLREVIAREFLQD